MEYMEKETAQVLSEHVDKDDAQGNAETDKRSVYVGNVDYHATPEELQEHFKSCGPINRITIMVDKYTCCPKGFAYMEFVEEESVKNAVLLNDSLFRGRQLKVLAKRTNLPGWNKGMKGKKGGKAPKGKGKGKGYYDPSYSSYGPVWGKPAKGKGKSYAPY
jgi:polyadenylate-binding protein 2